MTLGAGPYLPAIYLGEKSLMPYDLGGQFSGEQVEEILVKNHDWFLLKFGGLRVALIAVCAQLERSKTNRGVVSALLNLSSEVKE